MARQVFFNPFGSYTDGFNAGANQQINTQDAARRARVEDFDFNNMAPLRLNAAKREDTLGAAELPYRIAMAPIGLDTAKENLYDTQFNHAANFARTFNIPAPLESLSYSHYGITPHKTGTGPNGDIYQYFMPDPNNPNGPGLPVAQVANPGQHALDYLNFTNNFMLNKYRDEQAYRQAQIDEMRRRSNALMYSGLGSYYRGMGTYGVPITGSSLFGGGDGFGFGGGDGFGQPPYDYNLDTPQ